MADTEKIKELAADASSVQYEQAVEQRTLNAIVTAHARPKDAGNNPHDLKRLHEHWQALAKRR